MNIIRLITIMAVSAVFLPAVSATPGSRAIRYDGRALPVVVTENSVLSTTLDRRFVPASAGFQARFEQPDQTVPLYGLFVPGKEAKVVTVNSAQIEVDPIRRADGQVYMIDPGLLAAGENKLVIRTNGSDQNWAGTTLFSITDDYEQIHFHEAFWDGPSTAMADALVAADVQPTPQQDNYDALWYDCTWKPSESSAVLLTGTNVMMGGGGR